MYDILKAPRKQNKFNLEQKELTKESISEALFLLMNSKPYREISVVDICKKAGISRAAFYRYYPAKDAVLRRYFFEITESFRKKLRKLAPLSAKQLFTSIFEQYYNHRELLYSCWDAGLDYLVIDVTFKSFRDLSRMREYPPYELCHLAGSLYAIIAYWLCNKKPDSPEQMASVFCRINHLKETDIVRLPAMSSIEYLMELDNFTYRH